MFYIIRYIVCGLVLVITLIVTKSQSHKIRKRIISFGIVIAIFYCSVCYPIEQLHGFDTPQEVFNYMYTGNIDFIEYGQESAYVSYRDSMSQSNFKSAVIAKEDDKYVIKVIGKIEEIYSFLDDGCSVKIYRVKNTEDYYITVFGIFDCDNIWDSDNNIFQFSKFGEVLSTTVYIKDINNYQINVKTANKQQTVEVQCSDNGNLQFSEVL